ncbi:MAG: SGNH/GDSL hydrolase family protein [Candidatus Doudnabacteria bacterium]
MNDTKRKFRNLAIILIILLELEAVVYLVTDYHRKKILSSTPSFSTIAGSSVTFPDQSSLKYFYEPKADSEANNGVPDWLKIKPTYHINHDTLRGTTDYTPDKPPGTFRIITLGDSFTYGLFVNNEQSYPKVLEDELNGMGCTTYKKFEVINLAVQGYDVKYSEERYKLRGQKYDPDLVIWFLKYDDIDYINEILLPKVNDYLNKLGGGLIEPQVFNVWDQAFKDSLKQLSVKEIVDYNMQAFNEFNSLYKNNLLIYAPKYLLPSTTTNPALLLENYSKSRDGTYLYESPLDLVKAGKVFPDQHPNPEGHKAIAQDLLNYLLANKLITCK